MFKLTSNRRVTWPVTVNEPIDGGTVKKSEIKASFDLLPSSESDALLTGTDGNKALLRRALNGWEGLSEEDGTEIPFTAESVERVIDVTFVRVALLNSYFQAASGTAAQEKN